VFIRLLAALDSEPHEMVL